MPPRRQQGQPANPLDIVLQLVGLFFGGGQGGTARKTLATFCVVALCVVLTGGWYLFQPRERKQEIRVLVGNYSQQHKQIKITEVLWDIWTLYFQRPFVTTQVQGGENPLIGGEPQRANFPYELRTLHNTAYTVGYCDSLDNPAWVGYRVFDVKGNPRPPKRPESFFVDTRTAARVEPGDYTGSGYDRGHMAPNFAIGTRFGAAAQEETFKMSNVCPQRHRLNAGLWKDLELKIADNYTGRYGQVWVIDGPVFGPLDRLQRIHNKVPIPQAFYMIVVQQHEGGIRAEAFIMDQDTPASGSLAPYLVSIREVEHRTGLDFFPKLERSAQDQLETPTPTSVW